MNRFYESNKAAIIIANVLCMTVCNVPEIMLHKIIILSLLIVTLDNVEFCFTYSDVSMNFYFSNLIENPFFNYYEAFDSMASVRCFLNEVVFKNTNTNETFQAEYPGRCNAYDMNVINIMMNPRDYLRMITDEFINATSTKPVRLEMYTVDTLAAPFNLRIESNDTVECDLILNTYSYVGVNDFDYWINEGIILVHFSVLVDVDTVNISMLSLSSSRSDGIRNENNTLVLTSAEILNDSPGLALTVGIRMTSSDRALLASRGICTAGDVDFIQDCFIALEEGFAASHFREESRKIYCYSVYYWRTPSKL